MPAAFMNQENLLVGRGLRAGKYFACASDRCGRLLILKGRGRNQQAAAARSGRTVLSQLFALPYSRFSGHFVPDVWPNGGFQCQPRTRTGLARRCDLHSARQHRFG